MVEGEDTLLPRLLIVGFVRNPTCKLSPLCFFPPVTGRKLKGGHLLPHLHTCQLVHFLSSISP
jgi:hypothetical protein